MYLQVEGTSLQGQFSESRLSASPGFGLVLVRLTSELTMRAPSEDENPYYMELHGTVYLKARNGSLPFGVVAPPTTRLVHPRQGRVATQLKISIPTTHDALEDVERHRAGAGVELRFDLQGVLHASSGERWSLRGQPMLRQEGSEWERLLEQAGYGEFIRFAVRAKQVGVQQGEGAWSRALAQLRRAQNALLRGDPRGAIGELRSIIELLWSDLPGPTTGVGRRQRSLDERFTGVVAALKEVTHLSHHEDDTTKGETWTREDAVAAIAIVAALMQREGDDSPFT